MRTSEQIRSTTAAGDSGSPNTSIVFCRPASLTTLPAGESFARSCGDRLPGVGLAGVDALDVEGMADTDVRLSRLTDDG